MAQLLLRFDAFLFDINQRLFHLVKAVVDLICNHPCTPVRHRFKIEGADRRDSLIGCGEGLL